MDANPCIPENARNGREIESLIVLGKYDGAAVEGQAHALQLSERRAKRSARIRLQDCAGGMASRK